MKKIYGAVLCCVVFVSAGVRGVCRVEKNEPVHAQWGMLADLALQQAIMMGQGAADMLFYEDEQKKQKELSDQMKAISEDLKKSREALSASTKIERDKIGDRFKNQYAAVSAALTQASQDSLNETAYIQRLVGKSSEDARSFLTVEPVAWDRAFALSPVRLPPGSATGPTWYNVMKNAAAAGNWLYDSDLKGFVQCGYSLEPVFKSANVPGLFKYVLSSMADSKDDKTGTVKKFDPSTSIANIIFTQYYPTQVELKSGYTVRGELTLLNATFPFCAGIVFNKARYLAGSFERPFTFRFVGLYADKNKKIGLYVGQTSIEQSEGMPFIQSPFDKIFTRYDDADPAKITRSAQELYGLSASDLGATDSKIDSSGAAERIGRNQPTYIFELTVAQQTISVALSKKAADGTEKLLYFSDKIDPSQYPALGVPGADMRLAIADPKQNEALFWYHDIGLVASGCQALFNITKPENLMPKKSGT